MIVKICLENDFQKKRSMERGRDSHQIDSMMILTTPPPIYNISPPLVFYGDGMLDAGGDEKEGSACWCFEPGFRRNSTSYN